MVKLNNFFLEYEFHFKYTQYFDMFGITRPFQEIFNTHVAKCMPEYC